MANPRNRRRTGEQDRKGGEGGGGASSPHFGGLKDGAPGTIEPLLELVPPVVPPAGAELFDLPPMAAAAPPATAPPATTAMTIHFERLDFTAASALVSV